MTDLLLQHGSYFALVIILILTGAGLPIPEEIPVVAAGILSAHGQMNPWIALGCCLVGGVLGDILVYWIGYHFGRNVLQSQAWWVRFLRPEREAKLEALIENHGLKVLFFVRFLAGFRLPVYLSVGILRVPFRRFLLIDLFCATTMIGTFFILSYRYGKEITGWLRDFQIGLSVGVGVLVLAAVAYFWRWHRRKRAERAAESAPSPLPPPEPDDPSDLIDVDDSEQTDRIAQQVVRVEEAV